MVLKTICGVRPVKPSFLLSFPHSQNLSLTAAQGHPYKQNKLPYGLHQRALLARSGTLVTIMHCLMKNLRD